MQSRSFATETNKVRLSQPNFVFNHIFSFHMREVLVEHRLQSKVTYRGGASGLSGQVKLRGRQVVEKPCPSFSLVRHF